MAALLEIQDLVKHYGSVLALDGAHLAIDPGETIGLVGKNGAGKTTLLSIVAGFFEQDSGLCRFMGGNIRDRKLNGKINIQPQETCFKKGIPLYRQLVHFCRLLGMATAEAREQIHDLSKQLGTMKYIDKPVEKLSFGQAKRLNLLQAFLGTPALILLDEPTAGLDPIAAAEARRMIQSRPDGTSFLISSHNLYELQDMCTRVLVLDQGRIVNNIELLETANRDNILKIKLSSHPGETLVSALLQLPEITDLLIDQHDRSRLTLHFATPEPDRFQLRIQGIIIEHGLSVTQLNRGSSLSDNMRELMEADKSS